MVSVFEYDNYREFLKDYFNKIKEEKPQISHRYLAQKLGYKSSGFFSLIINHQSNISRDKIFKFAELLELNRRETDYFEALVLYNQAKNENESLKYKTLLLEFGESKVRQIEEHQFDFFKKWYYSAIREAIAVFPFHNDEEKLADFIMPKIKPEQVKETINLLKELGFIEEKDDGSFERTSPTLTTGQEYLSKILFQYNLEMGRLALRSGQFKEKGIRNFSTLSLSISENKYHQIIEEIRAFRKKLLSMTSDDEEPDRVYQLNFQLFPMSKKFKK